MARRRRTLSSRFCSFVLFSPVISCVQERTSCVYSKFPQSRGRRFTVSSFGVSLRVSDGEPVKTRRLPPTSSLGSSAKRAVPKSCVISLALVADEPGSSQIWRARSSTAAISMLFVGRDHHRSASPPSWLSVAAPTPQRLQPFAASTAWSLSRRYPPHSPAAGLSGELVPPSVSMGSSFELSDPKSFVESLDLVAENPGSFQISRAHSPTSAFPMLPVGRDHRRYISSPPCLFGSHASTPQQLPPSPVSLSRKPPLSHVAALTLGFQVLGLVWVLQRMGRFLLMGFMGLINQKPMSIFSQPNISNTLCRSWSALAAFFSLVYHQIALQQENMATVIFTMLHWRIYAVHPIHLGAIELPRYQNSSCRGQREIVFPHCSLPRYQNSSCRGQREIVFPHCSSPRYQNSSCRGQREIAFPILLLEEESCSTILLIFMALVCCACVARSGLELEGVSSETLLSDIFKGSAKVAVSMIVISVLVAVSIANNRSLFVLLVSQGIVSLTSSKVVKVRRLHDIYGLSVKIACNYPFIFSCLCIPLAFEAAMVLSSDVTNSSIYGE